MASNAAATDHAGQYSDGGHTMHNGHHANGHHTNGYDYAGSSGDMGNKPHQSMVSQVFQPRLGKIGNPGPLGLIGFALTTFVLGLYQCGAGLPGSNPLGSVGPDQVVFGLAIFFGGMAQFVAGIMEFTLGNTFGTTVHCSYGAFWLAFAMLLVPSLGIEAAYAGDQRAYSFAIGIFLILWCFLTLIFFLAALKTNIAILTVFGFLTLAFFFLSIAQFISTSHHTAAIRVNRAGGVFAVICAFAAFYAGSAGLMLQDTTYITLPLGELNFVQPPAHRTAA
ncbi:Ammonia transport outward protein 2 [Cladobotryum mycophilum]|uniref:Ammonia transport outward protein 2 n=1 Tax=Cladobotryum mycophilum TaxID=491253 RepID=A0ABR0STW4_9HYPO